MFTKKLNSFEKEKEKNSPDGLPGEIYQTFKEITPILHYHFHKRGEGSTSHIHFMMPTLS